MRTVTQLFIFISVSFIMFLENVIEQILLVSIQSDHKMNILMLKFTFTQNGRINYKSQKI
jgi:hypothetical protein